MVSVNEILRKKKKVNNVIQSSALVIDALKMLNSVDLSYLVVKNGDQFRGIFCERDYCRNVILKDRSSKTSRVEEVMTTDLPKVETRDTAEYCMDTMNQHKTRYLLAYDDAGFAGVITIHDLLRQVLSNREFVFDHGAAERLIEQEEGDKIF
ncbi:MAG: CBS domain-containing protein [Chitinophagales bacterium]